MVRTVGTTSWSTPALFTALQLQPGLVLAQSWNSLAAWCRDHLVPYPQLVSEHGVGAVVLAVEMRYPQRLCFFDSDTLTVRTRLGLRRRGTRLEQHTTITAAGRTAATVRTVLCPVAIREPISLTAEPAPLPDGAREPVPRRRGRPIGPRTHAARVAGRRAGRRRAGRRRPAPLPHRAPPLRARRPVGASPRSRRSSGAPARSSPSSTASHVGWPSRSRRSTSS